MKFGSRQQAEEEGTPARGGFAAWLTAPTLGTERLLRVELSHSVSITQQKAEGTHLRLFAAVDPGKQPKTAGV